MNQLFYFLLFFFLCEFEFFYRKNTVVYRTALKISTGGRNFKFSQHVNNIVLYITGEKYFFFYLMPSLGP